MSNLVDKNNNNPAITKYIIKLFRGKTCFTTDVEEGSSKTPRHEPGVIPNT